MRAALLMALVVLGGACQAPAQTPTQTPVPTAADVTLVVTVVAGPTCPVETIPPDPRCAPRAVEGAEIVVEEDGREVTRGRSDAKGMLEFALSAGVYLLVPQPVEGYMGTAPETEVRVTGSPPPVEVTLTYDTGIR